MPATPMLQERAVVDKVVSACISGGDEGGGVAGSDDIQPETEEFGLGCRKNRRFAESNNPRSSIDYSAKFSILLDKMKTPFSIVTG
ncbi:hypothetical protein Bca52824_040741 [Brassica carinata]|uniref:Uncharacterized protein n=1 Tax=Brassica carinata TaxID=52824 RepID=A0A8X7RU14_BRACI|nr:hypothetical protein Bca52824_040741 [Brassica carinata]